MLGVCSSVIVSFLFRCGSVICPGQPHALAHPPGSERRDRPSDRKAGRPSPNEDEKEIKRDKEDRNVQRGGR
jgi:hypothetical protein